MDLKKLSDLNALVQQWEILPEIAKLNLIRQLKKIGKLSAVKTNCSESMLCPLHQFKLSQPCGLKQCSYFVDSGKDSNCLYHSLDRSKKGRMTINETSECMKMLITDINKVSAEAFLKIRREHLKEKIAEASPISYKYIKGHCIHCEEYIQEELDLNVEPSLTIEYGMFGWCSLKCKESKPNWSFDLEHTYGTDFIEVLKHAYLLVVTQSTRNVDKEVDTLLAIPVGSAASFKRQVRSIM